MATPITSIKKHVQTPEEIQQEKLLELQLLITEQEQALGKILEITGELEEAGLLDAVQAMVKAREDLTEIAVHQASREPITNLINNLLKASGLLTSIDPVVLAKLTDSLKSGLDQAELQSENDDKMGMVSLMKSLNDPDINRAIRFGLHFLKGMGKGLGKE